MRFVSIVALFVLSAPAMAQETPAAPEKPKEEKKICRAGQSTGTIIPPKRICHTKAEWNQIDGANRGNTERFNDQMKGGGGFNGSGRSGR